MDFHNSNPSERDKHKIQEMGKTFSILLDFIPTLEHRIKLKKDEEADAVANFKV